MHRTSRGFSLVEVTIAMGIVVFALISLIGLLGVGLSTGKASTEDTRIAAASKYVMTESLRKPFSSLVATNYYFDFDGNPLPGPDGSYYHCMVTPVALSGTLASVSTNLVGVVAKFVSRGGKTNVFYFQRANE